MHTPFDALGAALDGDLSPETVAAALEDAQCAGVLACTPDLPPWAQALAAARCGAPPLTTRDAVDDEAARTAMMATLQHMSEEPARQTLCHLAETPFVGFFANHAATLCAWTISMDVAMRATLRRLSVLHR